MQEDAESLFIQLLRHRQSYCKFFRSKKMIIMFPTDKKIYLNDIRIPHISNWSLSQNI